MTPNADSGGRYEGWGDDGYDEIDYLIDNDPIELGRRYRLLLRSHESVRKHLLRAVEDLSPNGRSEA